MERTDLGPFGPMDLALGWLTGYEERAPLPAAPRGTTPRTTLEALLLPALERGPVGVPIFGGDGSAVLLGVAAAVARREGLDLPVPISLELDGPGMAEEARWQRTMVRHIGLEDRWERVAGDGQLELVGPHAANSLRSHGLLYPSHVAWVRPMMERLGSGTFAVAHAMDELWSWWPFLPLWDVLRRRRRPTTGTMKLGALALLPPTVRPRAVQRVRRNRPAPWLRPGAAAASLVAENEGAPSPLWTTAVRQMREQRCLVHIPDAYRRQAADHGMGLLSPWTEPAMAAAVLAHSTAAGFVSRAEFRHRWFADVFPPDAPYRGDRLAYGGAFFGPGTREFARSWSGDGLDGTMVDPTVLRDLWTSERHDARSGPLLQAAWLHDDRR